MLMTDRKIHFGGRSTAPWAIVLLVFFYLIIPTTDALAMAGSYQIPWDKVTFGHYEQDNLPDNGKEPISWYVLGVKDDKALLIAQYNLDCQPYHRSDDIVTWETSTLRGWLNDEFLNAAFTQEEQQAILPTKLRNEDTWPGVDGGSDTQDKIFLLSIAELKFYMPDLTSRAASITKYAKAQGVSEQELWEKGQWWLRSPGENTNHASAVFDDIEAYEHPLPVDSYNIGVRPALWIDLSRSSQDSVSEDNLENIDNETEHTAYSVGSKVSFGTYEQDNNLGNGQESVTWQVLAREKDKALLISVDNLDCQPYNEESTSVTWETCTLRAWLHSSFLNAAFTPAEQKAVMTTTLQNEDNSEYGTRGGNATSDRVFLLSISEAENLFSSDADRVAKNTAYTNAQGAYTNDCGAGLWWLHSPGTHQDYAARVYAGGSVDHYGYLVNTDCYAVRPALWLDLSSL